MCATYKANPIILDFMHSLPHIYPYTQGQAIKTMRLRTAPGIHVSSPKEIMRYIQLEIIQTRSKPHSVVLQ